MACYEAQSRTGEAPVSPPLALSLHHVIAFPQESRNVEIFRLIARRGGPHRVKRNHLGMRPITRFPKRYRRGIWLEAPFTHATCLRLAPPFHLFQALPP